MKLGAPPLQSVRLLDQVRERVRYLHYSLKTEKAYLYWIRFFIRWSATQSGGVQLCVSQETHEGDDSASRHNLARNRFLDCPQPEVATN